MKAKRLFDFYILFEDGEERYALVGSGPEQRVEVVRRGLGKEAVERERKRGGQMGRFEMLRHRLRQATEGLVWGSKEFVNAVYALRREMFGPKRKDGARKIRGTAGDELWTMRDLGEPEV